MEQSSSKKRNWLCPFQSCGDETQPGGPSACSDITLVANVVRDEEVMWSSKVFFKNGWLLFYFRGNVCTFLLVANILFLFAVGVSVRAMPITLPVLGTKLSVWVNSHDHGGHA